MDDLRVVTLIPTRATPGIQPSPVAQGSAGQVPLLAGLTPGTILSGFIINRDASGNPILRTNSGDIAFASAFFLNIGSEVVLRVENTGGQLLAHLLSVDGQPPEVAAAQSAFAQEPEVIVSEHLSPPSLAASQTQASFSAAPAPPAITVTGTLIALPLSDHESPLPIHSQLSLQILTLSQAASPIPEDIAALTLPTATPIAPAPANALSYSAYAKLSGTPTPVAPTSLATISSQQSSAPPTISLAIEKPATTANLSSLVTKAFSSPLTTTAVATPPALPSSPNEQTITATIIGREPSGEALAQTPLGIVRLPAEFPLSTGSTVTFALTRVTPPPPATIPPSPAPTIELAQQWDSLQQIVNLIVQNAPAAIPHLLPALPAIPIAITHLPPQSLSNAIMLFVAALRGGDFRSWLGQGTAQWLEDQGHGALIHKAEGEFATLAKQYAEIMPDRWQALFFPVAVEGEVHQTRLFVKRDRRHAGSQPGKKSEDTRFIVEVDLTQLGEMQMDGFVRRHGPEVQFDMVIRSLKSLSEEIQQDILKLYNDAGQLTGFKGSLVFQSVREFPANPIQELAKSSGPVTA